MFKYLRLVFILGPRIIWSYFAWMIKYSKHPDKYPLEVRYNKLRNLILFVFKYWHIDFVINNKELISNADKQYLIVSNHLSFADPLLIIANSDKPISFIAKKEVEKFPFIGRCVKSIDGIFLDRDDIRQEIKCINLASSNIVNKKLSYVIFPEGTRNKDPLSPCMEFKPGALKIAYKANVEIISLASYGSFRIFPKEIHLKKYPIHMSFISSYNPELFKEILTTDLAPKIHDEIKNEVDSLRIKSNEYLSALKKKRQ